MTTRYTDEAWRAFGRVVHSARIKAGFSDLKAWIEAVGRSDRMLLGLERGEPVGRGTLRNVEAALGWQPGTADGYLERANEPGWGLYSEIMSAGQSSELEPIIDTSIGLLEDARAATGSDQWMYVGAAARLLGRTMQQMTKRTEVELAAKRGAVEPSVSLGGQASAGEENQDSDEPSTSA